jgi:hypothetical protein
MAATARNRERLRVLEREWDGREGSQRHQQAQAEGSCGSEERRSGPDRWWVWTSGAEGRRWQLKKSTGDSRSSPRAARWYSAQDEETQGVRLSSALREAPWCGRPLAESSFDTSPVERHGF